VCRAAACVSGDAIVGIQGGQTGLARSEGKVDILHIEEELPVEATKALEILPTHQHERSRHLIEK
jgi:hypothetical protein